MDEQSWRSIFIVLLIWVFIIGLVMGWLVVVLVSGWVMAYLGALSVAYWDREKEREREQEWERGHEQGGGR